MFRRQKMEPFCGNEHNTNTARMNQGSQNPCWIENELKWKLTTTELSLFVSSLGVSPRSTTGWRSFAFPLFWVFFCTFCFILSSLLISFTLPPETYVAAVVVSILITSTEQKKSIAEILSSDDNAVQRIRIKAFSFGDCFPENGEGSFLSFA